ncbi:hypothetical protein JD292_04320 [Leucobacter sp. CSA2]|uniref:Uncharacterized protein n=1 Tax=Leucobacter edaphi TaxID=2796472 RepID=A0A934QB32_9MICO|nr:hypothetical protein [Leucobacter edaphi]MBK0421301.1 hypothetical protein [Leucobacter edaphi]
MEKRWAAIKLTAVLLYLGVLPLTPDLPLPFAFALLALALLAATPVIADFARSLSQRHVTRVQPSTAGPATPVAWPPLRPVAPGTRGTVRSRAPSGMLAVHG